MYPLFIRLLTILIRILKTVFKSRDDLILENLALRQQLATYKAKKCKAQDNRHRSIVLGRHETNLV